MKKTGIIFICLCLMLSVFGIFGVQAQDTEAPATGNGGFVLDDEPEPDETEYFGTVTLFWNKSSEYVGKGDCIEMIVDSKVELQYFQISLEVSDNLSFRYQAHSGNDTDGKDNSDNSSWDTAVSGASFGYTGLNVIYNSVEVPFKYADRWLDYHIGSYGDGYGYFRLIEPEKVEPVRLQKASYRGAYGIDPNGKIGYFDVIVTRPTVTLLQQSSGGNTNLQLLYLSNTLPETGFSSTNAKTLENMPKDLNYRPLNMMIEIPSLELKAEIVEVPNVNGGFQIKWLGKSIGLLEGSALPGEGSTILTGHNHLDNTTDGPFIALGTIEKGARIFVLDSENNLKTYVVYANEKVAENDVQAVDSIAAMFENSLTMITCEDERFDGGYANRRVVAARLLGE